ncbi:hypothetical protein PYW07_009917 [Mythimna separata]|uniref:C-type lectin domain-containing protein n=1 Tax=Mythimna separata TaxID=271217 RepID=A0AAD7YGJ4_MYTSE|nr:hypothetical protein PYW07_009917 [Mythimna separata]
MKNLLKCFVLIISLKFIEASFRCDYAYSLVAKAWFRHNVIPATWANARLRCSMEGATLASPTTPELEAEMTHIIKNFFASESEIFTGIHATISGSDFYTIEGW